MHCINDGSEIGERLVEVSLAVTEKIYEHLPREVTRRIGQAIDDHEHRLTNGIKQGFYRVNAGVVVIVDYDSKALLVDEAVGLRLVKRARFLVHGDVRDRNAVRVAAQGTVMGHNACLNLGGRRHAIGAPNGKPLQEHDRPRKILNRNPRAGRDNRAVRTGELPTGDEGDRLQIHCLDIRQPVVEGVAADEALFKKAIGRE